MPILTEDQRRLETVQKLLEEFQVVDETMPIQLARTFLFIATHEGCSLTDVMKRTGWAQSTLSRHLLDLGKRNRNKQPGLNLIKSEKDPMELRKNVYTLTPRGRTLVQRLIGVVEREIK